ncbi:hypothetical protein PBI_GAIA_49 [Mycobacterium phage Gaia]|uniref:Uncharacterized protein n=1 Tax=Mycobacterium phage Gaia TaxID=1486472 RepID=A0A068F2F0_9CAUD|nr:DNA methyltransferase [Mycobacterium phage Gaia]AID58869.1 hypothetical protein PBI_GAIA_49 [Mycobacterium phage Gaia]AYQ99994.1 hypothetical protein PBI_NEBKISS_53 [Mycobacterium phage Nebkiss]
MSDRIESIVIDALNAYFKPTISDEGSAMIARSILAALKDNRIALVELPEAKENWDGSMTVWPVTQSWRGEPYRDGEVNIRPSDGKIVGNGVSNPCDSPSDARSYAAALLAAAAAAERGDSHE